MKSIFKYSIIFVLGLLIGLFFLWKSKQDYRTQQADIIINGIKNVSKLVVTEASFSEVYNYQDVDKYFFETFEFQKKVILLVHAKVQVSYDLKKLEITLDSVKKKLILKHIPEEELQIIPDFKYYDLEQSMWNTFTKQELNEIQQNSIDNLLSTIEVSNVKAKAKKQLSIEIQNILNLAKLVDWTIEDQTEEQFLEREVLFDFKD